MVESDDDGDANIGIAKSSPPSPQDSAKVRPDRSLPSRLKSGTQHYVLDVESNRYEAVGFSSHPAAVWKVKFKADEKNPTKTRLLYINSQTHQKRWKLPNEVECREIVEACNANPPSSSSVAASSVHKHSSPEAPLPRAADSNANEVKPSSEETRHPVAPSASLSPIQLPNIVLPTFTSSGDTLPSHADPSDSLKGDRGKDPIGALQTFEIEKPPSLASFPGASTTTARTDVTRIREQKEEQTRKLRDLQASLETLRGSDRGASREWSLGDCSPTTREDSIRKTTLSVNWEQRRPDLGRPGEVAAGDVPAPLTMEDARAYLEQERAFMQAYVNDYCKSCNEALEEAKKTLRDRAAALEAGVVQLEHQLKESYHAREAALRDEVTSMRRQLAVVEEELALRKRAMGGGFDPDLITEYEQFKWRYTALEVRMEEMQRGRVQEDTWRYQAQRLESDMDELTRRYDLEWHAIVEAFRKESFALREEISTVLQETHRVSVHQDAKRAREVHELESRLRQLLSEHINKVKEEVACCTHTLRVESRREIASLETSLRTTKEEVARLRRAAAEITSKRDTVLSQRDRAHHDAMEALEKERQAEVHHYQATIQRLRESLNQERENLLKAQEGQQQTLEKMHHEMNDVHNRWAEERTAWKEKERELHERIGIHQEQNSALARQTTFTQEGLEDVLETRVRQEVELFKRKYLEMVHRGDIDPVYPERNKAHVPFFVAGAPSYRGAAIEGETVGMSQRNPLLCSSVPGKGIAQPVVVVGGGVSTTDPHLNSGSGNPGNQSPRRQLLTMSRGANGLPVAPCGLERSPRLEGSFAASSEPFRTLSTRNTRLEWPAQEESVRLHALNPTQPGSSTVRHVGPPPVSGFLELYRTVGDSARQAQDDVRFAVGLGDAMHPTSPSSGGFYGALITHVQGGTRGGIRAHTHAQQHSSKQSTPKAGSRRSGMDAANAWKGARMSRIESEDQKCTRDKMSVESSTSSSPGTTCDRLQNLTQKLKQRLNSTE